MNIENNHKYVHHLSVLMQPVCSLRDVHEFYAQEFQLFGLSSPLSSVLKANGAAELHASDTDLAAGALSQAALRASQPCDTVAHHSIS